MTTATPVSRASRSPRSLRVLAAASLLALGAAVALPAAAEREHAGPRAAHAMAEFHGGFGGLPMSERALDRVGASAEQKAQIREIMKAARADMKTQREAGRTLQNQARDLFVQPTVDARQAEVLRQQMLAQRDQSSQRWMQALLDVSRVLTVEQRQSLAQQLEQRRELMQRHQRERHQLDGARPGPRERRSATPAPDASRS